MNDYGGGAVIHQAPLIDARSLLLIVPRDDMRSNRPSARLTLLLADAILPVWPDTHEVERRPSYSPRQIKARLLCRKLSNTLCTD